MRVLVWYKNNVQNPEDKRKFVIPETGEEATAFYAYHYNKERFYNKHEGEPIPVELWRIEGEESQPYEYAPVLMYLMERKKEDVEKNAKSLAKCFTRNSKYPSPPNRIYQDPLKFVGLKEKTLVEKLS